MSEQVTTNHVNQGERVRLMCVGVLAGAIAGLVTGIGARINMRIIALATGSVPGLSLATLVILLTGIYMESCQACSMLPSRSICRDLGF